MTGKTALALVIKRLRIWLGLALALTAVGALAQDAPRNFRVYNTSSGSITLTWDEGSGYDSYSIAYKVGEGDETVAGSTGGNSFTINGLSSGTTYTIYLDYASGKWLSTTGSTARQESSRSDDDDDEPAAAPQAPLPKPLPLTCPYLPMSIFISGHGLHTHCKQVDAGGVGVAELIAQGILDAVDIFGALPTEMRVCFRRLGRLVFLDAATAPRTQSELPAEYVDGMTCGRIHRPGTVVLLQGNPPAVAASDSPPAAAGESPPPAPAQTGPTSTTSCEVETTGHLSLRAGPSVYYTRFVTMPRGARLVARARIDGWYMVNYDGQLGWASGSYLAVSPGCAGLGEAGAIILSPTVEPPAAAEEAEEAPEETAVMTDARQAETTEYSGQALTNCQLRTGDVINLRQRPGVENPIVAEIPFQTVLEALERWGDWFRVEYLEQMGWVNIGFVFRNGACG